MSDVLVFTESTHSYYLGAERVTGVSEALTLGGFDPDFTRIDPAVLTLASERGTYAHLACEFDDRGELDFDGLDPQLVPYVLAWRKFRKKEAFEPILDWMERPIVSRRLRVAGKPDAPGYRRGKLTMVDRKTGIVIKRAMGLQLGLYVLAGAEDQPAATDGEREWLAAPAIFPDPLMVDRLVVQLKSDGSYRLYPYDEPADYVACTGAMAVADWKLRHGKQPDAVEAA